MKHRAIAVTSISLMAFLLAGGRAPAQQIGQPGLGLILAKRICSECHAVEKGVASSPNILAPRFEDIANTPGMTQTALSAALQTSHSTMPNVVLTGDDLSHIIAYILSLKRGE